jgi:hypothetical protein
MSGGCGRPTSRRAMKNQQLSTKALLSGVIPSIGFIEHKKIRQCAWTVRTNTWDKRNQDTFT